MGRAYKAGTPGQNSQCPVQGLHRVGIKQTEYSRGSKWGNHVQYSETLNQIW